jgi:hypothetical protein
MKRYSNVNKALSFSAVVVAEPQKPWQGVKYANIWMLKSMERNLKLALS